MAIVGSLIGLVAGLGQKYLTNSAIKLEIEREKNNHDFQIRRGDQQLEMVKAQSQREISNAEMGGVVEVIRGEMTAFAASINDQTQATKGAKGKSANAIPWIRPAITFCYVVPGLALAAVFAISHPANVEVVMASTVAAVPEMAGMTVGWWFGSRDTTKTQKWFQALAKTRAVGGQF